MDHFTGKVAIITGAAVGVGGALGGELATRGCHLAVVNLLSESKWTELEKFNVGVTSVPLKPS